MGKDQRYGSHSVSRLTAHIVWVTKYRYHVLKGDIQVRCRDLIKQICDTEDVKILKYYSRLENIGITKPLGMFYKYFKKAMVGNLLSSRPNLAVFDLYKLSYLASINQNPSKIVYNNHQTVPHKIASLVPRSQ